MVNSMCVVEEFLKDSVSFLAYIPMGGLTETEARALLDLLNENEMIETSKGYVWGFNTGITHFSQETNSIRADIDVKDHAHVVNVLQELLEKANIQSKILIPGRAGDFSMDSRHEFENGKLVSSEANNYYDNGILDSGDDTFVESKAKELEVDLDKIPMDDPEVFAAFLNRDITKWCYAFRQEDENDKYLEILKPRSMEDIMVYYSILMSTGFQDGRELIKEYVARRDGQKPVPQDIPEELKRTFGLVCYYEQQEFSTDPELNVPHPMPIMCAKLSCEATYRFVYLCQKYGVHNNLK